MCYSRIFLLLVIINIFCGCQKYGCKDEEAINYNSKVKKSDGSCYYQSRNRFYYSEFYYDDVLLDSGSTNLYIYVDSVLQMNLDVVPNTQILNCESNSEFGLYFDTVYYKSEYKHVLVKDQNGKVFKNKYYQFELCNSINIGN